MSSHLPGELLKHKQLHVCCPKLVLLCLVRRRHFRRTLYIIIVLFTLVSILKVQQLISNLTHADEASSRLELRWASTNIHANRFHTDLETVRAQRHFAEHGVHLIKMPSGSFNKGPSENSMSHNWNNTWESKEAENINRIHSDDTWNKSNRKHSLAEEILGVGVLDPNHVEDISEETVISGTVKQNTTFTTSTKQRGLFLVVLVVSKPNNVLLRQAIRKTWAKDALDLSVWVRFIVGREEKWNDIVDREDNMHGDMIVIEEEDTYEYLPYKVLDGFMWVLHQPLKPKFVMKVDDDTIINLPYLIQELHNGAINTTQILGAICVNSTVVRDPGDKWAVSVLDYPFSVYPVYAYGGGYVMSISVVVTLVDTRSKTFDWIHLEDVYITGILAMKAGISHVAHRAFSYWTTEKASACDFVQERRITSVNHTEREFYAMYTDIQALLRTRNLTECNSGAS